jgi:hypothetical protein
MPLLRLALLFLAAHLATALYFVFDRTPGTAAALTGFPLDDGWIHMVYARSLSALQGFAYNPGQPETGATSPLWATLLVPASWAARLLHVSVAIPAKLTCLLTAVAASITAARLLRALGVGSAAQVVAGLALAADPSLAFAQVSGMEVMLASALAFWSLAELASERYVLAGIAAGLAPLARPEMALLTVMVLGAAQWRLRQRRARANTHLRVVLPTAVLVGGWVSYCLAVSGYPLPNTFYAKFTGREDYLTHNLALIVTEILPASPWFVFGTGAVSWAIGGIVLWRRGLAGRLVVVFPCVFFVGVSASQLLQAAEPFYYLRYVLPAYAFVVTTLAAGAMCAVEWTWQRRSVAWAPAYAIGVLILVVSPLAKLPSTLAARAHLYAWNCQNIEELNVAMALWLRDHVPTGEAIAVNDAGASRYFADHPILDFMGLNHHGLLHREPAALAQLGRATWLSAFPSLVPAQIRNDALWTAVHRTSTANLTICRRCQQWEMVAYRRSPEAPEPRP